MAIIISPLEAADMRRIMEIVEHSLTRTMQLIYELPLTEESLDEIAAYRASRMIPSQETSSGKENADEKNPPSSKIFAFKAVDSETGAVVGTSRWEIHYQDEDVSKTIEEQAKERITPPMPQARIDATYAFGAMLARVQRETLAKPALEKGADPNSVKKMYKRVSLDLLVVDKEHQGKGIGKALLQWGLDQADRLGLIAYLEATQEGRPLYEKYGFEPVKEDIFRFSSPDFEGELAYTIMIRQPRLKN
ncbi:acyl-CoA N-acyltransferase [Talaromyces proteolyticus]|uniref:Acyl-CoA N-acyltransferase n=1 Tax=Talaromyces proteolyticus TaxID=1131652 RepID=A0AAD4KV05_9EURO|nr:acyl-CoA N-acyltransferase [Talaromyces proteolyticus]KAH8698934.1 acyl-CoA N-acyltransferase [Talaromyces proteolyticus]